MKVLHITPHLGGGVGKAHAEICGASNRSIDRTYLLLEEPRDRRFADLVCGTGAQIVMSPTPSEIHKQIETADIVQFEFWNHPRIFETLALSSFPPMRSAFWCHISGLFAPLIADALFTKPDRFIFTSPCSLRAKAITAMTDGQRQSISTIGSAFGFPVASQRNRITRDQLNVGYLGTVDFVKMHPAFFTMIDDVPCENFVVSVWGGFSSDGDVARAHQTMKYPDRVRLLGHCSDPSAAMSEMDIFLYPLHPEHYGTAENALIEAMSLGVAPLVLANPAEVEIVKDGVTGFVATSVEHCSQLLGSLLKDTETVLRVGAQAAADVSVSHTPQMSALRFEMLYGQMLQQEKRSIEFSSVLGKTPREWFLSTQSSGGPTSRFLNHSATSKGSIRHFLECFPNDPGLVSLL